MNDGNALLETLTVTLFAAVILQVLAQRLRLPAIVLLLLGGILLGPEVLGVVRPEILGGGLETVISMAVAVILFEGGLSLEAKGLQLAPTVIRRMLTVGVAITWLGTALAIYWLYDFSVTFAAMAGSLTIVTGPTVIGPILRRIRLGERLHQILQWEGVLIDPIGVFIALGCFEWVYFEASVRPVVSFVGRIALGIAVGFVGGRLILGLLKRNWIDESYDNLFVFTSALVIFGLCDLVLPESGLLAVTCAGLVVGSRKGRRLKAIRRFKLDLTQLAIGVLFILLAARLQMHLFGRLGLEGVALLLLLMVVIRPLNVMVSTWRSPLSWSEKLFLSSLAPRGIVAAAMASLFTLRFSEHGGYAGDAWFLEVFTYSVIGATVFLQGLSAPLNAHLMGVTRPVRRVWLIVGARRFGRALCEAVWKGGAPAMLVDINADNVRQARARGLVALEADILDVSLLDDSRFAEVGSMLCATGNVVLDELACQRWESVLEPNGTYRLWDPRVDDTRIAEDESERATSGQPLWPHLGPIHQLEQELDLGDATIGTFRVGDDHTLPEGMVRLFALRGGGMQPTTVRYEEPPLAGKRYVVLDRKLSRFAALVRALVSIDTPRPTADSVLRRLLEETAAHNPGIDRKRLLETLLERERDMPNYVGQGVAVAHTYCAATGEPICVVGRLEDGLAVETFDGVPIRLIFLLISPMGKAERHLEALGRLARLASDHKLVATLLGDIPESEGLRLMRTVHQGP